jgi:hypothetical protein
MELLPMAGSVTGTENRPELEPEPEHQIPVYPRYQTVSYEAMLSNAILVFSF